MVSNWFKAIVVDVVLVLFGYLVVEDLQWRSSYAVSERLTPSYTYLPFTRFFNMSGRIFQGSPQQLVSPPTFDWVQFIIAVLVAVNLWYLYLGLRKRGTVKTIEGDDAGSS
jgi:hypothetical protein